MSIKLYTKFSNFLKESYDTNIETSFEIDISNMTVDFLNVLNEEEQRFNIEYVRSIDDEEPHLYTRGKERISSSITQQELLDLCTFITSKAFPKINSKWTHFTKPKTNSDGFSKSPILDALTIHIHIDNYYYMLILEPNRETSTDFLRIFSGITILSSNKDNFTTTSNKNEMKLKSDKHFSFSDSGLSKELITKIEDGVKYYLVNIKPNEKKPTNLKKYIKNLEY